MQSSIIRNGLSLIPNDDVDDIFDTRSLVSNESDYEVIDTDEGNEVEQSSFTAKNFGIDGLVIKVIKKSDSDELNTQIENACEDEMVSPILKAVSEMAECTFAAFPNKNFVATFTEEK